MATNFDRGNDPTEPRQQPPVTRYAIIIALAVVIGLVSAVMVGRTQTSHPNGGAIMSPLPNAGTGPSPR